MLKLQNTKYQTLQRIIQDSADLKGAVFNFVKHVIGNIHGDVSG